MNSKTGFFCIDKPKDFTSHDVVAKMRKILNMKKVGHSGTLDPMATGVLIVGCGTSTRLLDYVQSGIKEYVADIRFGIKTTSGDAQGEFVESFDMNSLNIDDLKNALEKFIGDIEQIPPMVSAIKIDGKKLYEYERKGIQVERKARKTYVESISIENFGPSQNGNSPEARIIVLCSAGTYIRTLAEDIAATLGGFAHLIGLRRTKNGNIGVGDCISLEELSSMSNPFDKIIEPQKVLSHFVHLDLTQEQTLAVSHGKELLLNSDQEQQVDEGNQEFFITRGRKPRELVAVFEKDKAKKLKSRCVVFLDDLAS